MTCDTQCRQGGRRVRRQRAAKVDRVRQEHAGRVLLSPVEAHGIRQDHCQGQAARQTVPVQRPTAAGRLQKRLLQRRR